MKPITLPEEILFLEKYFDIVDLGKEWGFDCLKCKKGWSLVKGNRHRGNILFLLNHGRSHEPVEMPDDNYLGEAD